MGDRMAERGVDVSKDQGVSHSGRSPRRHRAAGHTARCFEPHGDLRRCGQSGAAAACMWCGAWIALRWPFRGWFVLVLSVIMMR